MAICKSISFLKGINLKVVMSNQRPGKIEKKLDRNGDMQVFKFFKTAAKLLNEEGKEDEAFYMEQMVDWLRSGKPLPTSEEQITRALGV